MILDGASCHGLKNAQIPPNIILESLPPYCPDLNPTENIWDDMRENFFHNIAFQSMDDVNNQLIEASKFYENNNSCVKSITGWEWIISML